MRRDACFVSPGAYETPTKAGLACTLTGPWIGGALGGVEFWIVYRKAKGMVSLRELVDYTDSFLEVSQFEDYCPNGLQVEGRAEVHRLVSGVTACLALLEAAVDAGADAVLVHHGYFWKGEDSRLVGMKRRRLKYLLEHDLSLLAYHLPLDAHAQVGNNVQLAKRLNLLIDGRFPNGDGAGIALYGRLREPTPGERLRAQLESVLGRAPLYVPGPSRPIETIGWCTGAAQGFVDDAAAMGLDAYLSGEISEQTVHSARESNVHYFSAGHHATERYGAAALGEHLAEHFAIAHENIDVENPA
jgi:dinuclear metal center YbgI/SA1388 family protein